MYTNLHGDELRLKQIMNNILSNAIKYTEEGEIEFTISYEREGDIVWLIFKVSDTGQGIKEEDIEKLWGSYSQLETLSNRKIEGAGLGLSITKKLCELMDGSIHLESEFGKGSVFTVRLKQRFVTEMPIGPETVKSLCSFSYSAGKRSTDTQLKRIYMPYAHVLIVDDNLTNLDVARGIMKPYGMKIDCVDSGQKAVDAMSAKDKKYDAIFMDQMMPGMDGLEAARLIREIGSDYTKNIPIIALTANAVLGNEEMFLSKGFQAFLSKPIDISRLDEVIRQWIRDKEKEKLYSNVAETVESEETKKDSVSLLQNVIIAGLDIKRALKQFRDDEEAYIDVLRSYAANTRDNLDLMTKVSEEKIKDYEVTVHGVKGSCYGICADELGKVAEALEKAAKSGDWEFISKHNSPFIDTARKFISELERMISEIDSQVKKPIKDKPDNQMLTKLRDACDTYDMDEVDEAMKEISRYQYTSDEGLAQWLEKNVELMNFTEIVEKLS
jgi:CheY-like chemotaxis protein/anti-sigma regulatory factor (Ser/Thr protein kinase)